ncbi:hypothetical protein PENDEC_c036G03382 [Penicillium decumbens]|uniref:Transcription factor domain-containing protein n=1 Tax=Penicillium decumbens TaxID=69771 RepID=A0A1V6NUE6_PENDC|nr:hypothetical protein PENDEC_c036G03382 [Penicillium decumbens]
MPFRIRANVALPANVDDEELFGVTRSSLQSSPQRLTQMSYLLCKFNLYNIAFEICRLSSSASLPPRDQVLKLDQQLGTELKKHTSLFENVTDMPFYHVAHFYIVSNYTQHLQLLLHRPYIGAINSTSSREPLEAQIRESYQRCNDSAMKILSNFESFHHSTQMRPYRWYINGFGSFQAFMAVTTLLVIMANRDIAPTSNLAMTTAIKSCMSIFRELSRNSEICAKALAVLERSGDTRMSEFQQATFGNPSFATPPIPMPRCAASDTWNYFPDMETFIRDIPSEQWLFPSGFPWGNLRSI